MRLTDAEAATFYAAWGPLLWWTNEQRKIVPPLPRAFGPDAKIPIERAVKVRDVLWQDTGIIHQFVRQNPAGLTRDLLALVASWEHRRQGRFFVCKHYKKHTLLLDEKNGGFAVLGLYSTWEEMVPGPLPILVEAVLLPFGDRIIHDGLVTPYNVHFGPGIRRSISGDVATLKAKGGPIRSLLPANGGGAERHTGLLLG
jgi:hypothetical protein